MMQSLCLSLSSRNLAVPIQSASEQSTQLICQAKSQYGSFEEDEDPYRSNNQEDYYGPAPTSRRQKRSSDPSSGILGILQNQKYLGGILLAAGFLLSLMGIMLFFEGNLLRIGNICFIAGIFLLIGPSRVSGYFLKESRLQATTLTVLGILLVFLGKPKIGILVEIFGLLNLFGNMFPLLLSLGKRMPIVGDVLSAFDDDGKGRKSRPRSRAPRQQGYRPEQEDEIEPRF